MSQLRKKEKVTKEMTFKENDKLNRQNIAENFNLLFEDISQPFVIALDSPWGTGKTQFIYMWKNLLKEQKRNSIYINLWEEDFLRNPFFSLTGAFFKKFKEEKIGKNKTREELKKIGWELGRAAVSKLFHLDMNDLITEDFNEIQKQNKTKFKNKLTELANKIRKKTNFPLLVFVDELDRCRPNYAIEFLEIIKHFFDVENIIFVLGIDMEQLQYSVKSLYGEAMNAKEYLRKFIDMSYSFPDPLLDNYLEFLFSEFQCGNKEKNLIKITKEVIKKFNPSLRKVDHLFTRLKLIEEDVNNSYIQASFFLSLKIFHEERYDKIVNQPCSLEDILDLKIYFGNRFHNYGEIVFWKIANDLILRNSNTENEYKNNLVSFFLKLAEKSQNLLRILPKYTSWDDSHFSILYLSDILLGDKKICKEENQKKIRNIFYSRSRHLTEFFDLINKIDFLEGLNFSREDENENQTVA